MATPQPRPRNPLARRRDESREEWAKRMRVERGPMPEELQRRISAILRTSAAHPDNIAARRAAEAAEAAREDGQEPT